MDTCQPASSDFCRQLPPSARSEESETWVAKTVNFLTGLPACVLYLVFLLQTGASPAHCWVLTYPLFGLIALLGLLYCISLVSTSAAHTFTEYVCLLFLAGASTVTNIDIPHGGNAPVHAPAPFSPQRRPSNEQASSPSYVTLARNVPAWLQQLVVLAVVLRPDEKASCLALVGVFTAHRLALQFCRASEDDVTEAYSGMSAAAASSRGWHGAAARLRLPEDELRDASLELGAVSLVYLGLLQLCGVTFGPGLVVVCHALATDRRTHVVLRLLMENSSRWADVAEGCETHHSAAVAFAAQGVLAAVVAVWFGGSGASPLVSCALVVAAAMMCVCAPLVRIWTEVMPSLHEESLRLQGVPIATTAELVDYADVCAICLGEMTCARVTACHHLFHGRCLKTCLLKRLTCPMCSQPLEPSPAC